MEEDNKLVKRIQKISPQSGDCVIFWIDKLDSKTTKGLQDKFKIIKELFPGTVFLLLPHKNVIKGLSVNTLEKMIQQIDSLKAKMEQVLLLKK